MVADVSAVSAYRNFSDQFYFLRRQAIWFLLGLMSFVATVFIDYRRLRPLAPFFLLITIIFLVIVLIPGLGVKVMGARRWLGLGELQFQPAELAKLSLAIYFASFFANKRSVFPFFVILTLFIFLIVIEPDLGTTLVIAGMALMVFFASGFPLIWLGILGGLGSLVGMGLILFSSYRKERLLTFLDPMRDPLGASYHIRQILIAIGAGGLSGVGLGQSRQKYDYLPAVTTDSIYAVIAEEMGFIVSALLIIAFLLFIFRGLKIANEAPDDFGRLLAVGITSWIGLQAMINFAAMVALVPLTGIPMPFISYGGSSLVLVMAGAGILVGISRSPAKKR